MALNKVEICGVNTARLPILTNEEKDALFIQIRQGDAEAREQFIKGNLRLVLSVIRRFSSAGENVDDLFQIGCIGLCKAAQTDRPGRGAFSTYAYILIRNEIYNELERGTRYAREVSSCYLELEDDPRQEDYEQQLRCRELMSLLDRAEATATGITAKGIRALRMMCDGYSCREISAHYDTTPNNITAWMSKARKYLASFAQLSPSV